MARLTYILGRLCYEFSPAPIHSQALKMFGKAWKCYCPACENPVGRFAALPDFYFEELEGHGSDLRIEDFETCNFNAYQCPHCGATDRDRLYALYLAKRLAPAETEREKFALLDIAPAAALSRHIKRKYRIRYRTADLYMKNVDDRVDVTSMNGYADGSFDTFICSHVLEHVGDDRKALAELRRVLKPGGWGIAMVPISLAISDIREGSAALTEAERWKQYGQGDHARLYSRTGFKRRLEEAGFAVRQFGSDYFGPEEMVRCGLSASSVLYVVEKPN